MRYDKEPIEIYNIRSEMLLDPVTKMSKNDISDVKRILTQPINPMDTTDKKVIEIVPNSLKTFLHKVLSVLQKLIALAVIVRKRMPKQAGLGIFLKNSLRSKELITHLNNLGHSICYDEVLQIGATSASKRVIVLLHYPQI